MPARFQSEVSNLRTQRRAQTDRSLRFNPKNGIRQVAVSGWPVLCLTRSMSALAFEVNQKSGDYIKATVVPANRTAEPRFVAADGVIIAFFLLCVSGLVYLLLS